MRPSIDRRIAQKAILAVGLLSLCKPVLADEPFDYFRNSWSVIGLKDYKDGTRITPDNKLLLSDGRQLTLRVGQKLRRLSREQTKTLMDGWMPIVLLNVQDGNIRYEIRMWATPLPTVKDWTRAFEWPTEGENYFNWIVIKASNSGPQTAPAVVRAEITRPGDSKCGIVEHVNKPVEFEKTIEVVLRIPFAPVEDPGRFATERADDWLNKTMLFWGDLLLSKAARIEVPCEKATEALRASHVCQLIANDHGQVRGGEGFYDEFYIRDGAYQLLELEEAGLSDAAAKAVTFFLKAQRSDGRFETQKDQFDANGQAVWTIWQYYLITGDDKWLAEAYPQMRKAVDWTMQARRKAPADSPFAGLLPPNVADGEFLWDGKHHIVGYDFWNLRGMICTAEAAKVLGKADENRELLAEVASYRKAIDAAQQRTGLAFFPPSWEKEGTHWGDSETLWPTELFPADDSRVAALIAEVRRHHGGGFVEGTIRWTGLPDAIHPYMSAYTTMASLVRGEDEQVVEDFYWYLLHSTAAHTFPEGIFYKRRFAWGNTIPHGTGAANYALMLRHMLIHERGNELHLLPAVPDWWLDDGKRISIEHAPTHFGEISLSVHGTANGVQVTLSPPHRRPPSRIVLHLPASRPLAQPVDGVTVQTRPDQKKRWDLPTIVKLYNETAPPLVQTIPGLVDLPLDKPLTTEQCQMLDLSRFANTNPLTSPFGVPNVGPLVFSNLPLGLQNVGGVPFRIIDPARNEGRGFIVLASPTAPKDRTWPTQVEIPVNLTGKRLYVLGNVHGWGPGDAGTGEFGAVSTYEIQYEDGQTQIVPLITGITCDDWTSAPEASSVFCGLQGKSWHLYVLGVDLRPKPVKQIVFRDLGTPAAPVLAAMTIER
jgi:hypothetical protein